MRSNNAIGLHLRLQTSLSQVIQEAADLELSCVQFFLVEQTAHQYLPITPKDKKLFLDARHSFLKQAFIHSSYWINPASSKVDIYGVSRMLLRKEIRIAQSLEIPYLVLHGGSAKGYPATPQDPLGKQQGIEALASMLNTVLKNDRGITILLENTAHGCRTLGNDLEDFVKIKQLLDFPEKIGFCLDTAHAFSYGYDLSNIEAFIDILEQTVGMDNIRLVHLNDSVFGLGSQQDKHAAPGKGLIGKNTLLPFIQHPLFSNLPKIIEPPIGDLDAMREIIADIATW